MAKSYDFCLSLLLRLWPGSAGLLVAATLVASLAACARLLSGAPPRMPILEFLPSSPLAVARISDARRGFGFVARQLLPAVV
jgi:hypothetical protein